MERRRHIDDRLSALVRQAAAEGDLRHDVSPDVISRLIFGMVNSLTDWYRPGGPLDDAALAATISGVLFEGLQPRAHDAVPLRSDIGDGAGLGPVRADPAAAGPAPADPAPAVAGPAESA
jgi:hypothetical protein